MKFGAPVGTPKCKDINEGDICNKKASMIVRTNLSARVDDEVGHGGERGLDTRRQEHQSHRHRCHRDQHVTWKKENNK